MMAFPSSRFLLLPEPRSVVSILWSTWGQQGQAEGSWEEGHGTTQ